MFFLFVSCKWFLEANFILHERNINYWTCWTTSQEGLDCAAPRAPWRAWFAFALLGRLKMPSCHRLNWAPAGSCMNSFSGFVFFSWYPCKFHQIALCKKTTLNIQYPVYIFIIFYIDTIYMHNKYIRRQRYLLSIIYPHWAIDRFHPLFRGDLWVLGLFELCEMAMWTAKGQGAPLNTSQNHNNHSRSPWKISEPLPPPKKRFHTNTLAALFSACSKVWPFFPVDPGSA